jgi:Tfp pilus assembly PilM family ATPase
MAKSYILALNFDNDSIKFIEFERKSGKNIIHKIGTKRLPENSCKNNYGIFDSEKVKDGLKELLTENKIKATKATYLIPEKSVIKKTTTLPKTSTDKEIYKLIKRNSKQYTGEFADKIHFDFYSKSVENEKRKEIYILAVSKTIIEERDNVLIECGLEPEVADIPSNSLNRVNKYVREYFYKKNHQTLLKEEFLVFIKKENQDTFNVMIFDKEQKESLTIFKNSLQEVVDEINNLLEDNKIKDKFGGFAFFDMDPVDINVDDEHYVFISSLLDANLKFKNKINLDSQEWLPLSGLIQRERNEY